MYSFEGEFRRRPQQNLAGASAYQNLSRDALLKKAHQERIKREDYKKRLISTIKIQAYVRSFINRIKCKNNQRSLFDSCLHQNSTLNEIELILLIRRLLFFYDQQKDSSRLIFISQQLLKQWSRVLQNGGSFFQIQRLLVLHLKLLNTRGPQSRDSLAVPLRMLEVFTCVDTIKKVMNPQDANIVIFKTLLYIVKRGYFREIRKLLEDKTPPLYGPSASAPTPLAASLFALLLRPFSYVLQMNDPEFNNIVMLEFASCILCPEMSEVIKMYLLPALKAQPTSTFPYSGLISALSSADKVCPDIKIEYSSWLLYSLLLLEPQNYVNKICGIPNGQRINGSCLSHPFMLQYLALIARLTSNFLKKSPKKNTDRSMYNEPMGYEGDSDSDSDEPPAVNREATVNSECIHMMNDNNSCILQACTNAGQNDWTGEALEQISAISHHLLLSHKMAVHIYKLLYTLAFEPWFLRALWNWSSNLEPGGGGNTSVAVGRGGTLLASISQGLGTRTGRLLPPLATFCSLYSLLLATLHDEELADSDLNPIMGESNIAINSVQAFSLTQLGPLCVTLRQLCMGLIELAFPESRPNVGEGYKNVFSYASSTQHDYEKLPTNEENLNHTAVWVHLFKVSVRLLRQLHTRDQRLNFTRGEWDWCGGTQALPLLIERPHHLLHPRRHHCLRQYRPFTAFTALTREDCEKGPPLTTKEVRTLTILKETPFVVPFSQRVLIFQGLNFRDKQEYQGDLTNFLQGPSIQIVIRRSHIYEDAFIRLNSQNDLRLKMRVQLMNEAGLEEAGVDGGGVFREFLSELLRTACDPNRGFFRLTKDNMLYPNPAVHLLVENFHHHYYFIGRMLGKALYEGLLVELPLAEFFLQAVVGEERGNEGEADIHRLAALDERLHRSLLQLRAMPAAAVADLGLDFTVMSDELGEQRVEELKAGGANIPVTGENRIEYIHLVAEWKLSRQVRAQVTALRQGLSTVIPLAWLRIFCSKELRLLISGAESAVDVDDLKNHTNYAGGYGGDHPTIKCFWKVVENFTDIQKRQLLKFVTSCSRPPLLGFKDLDPPFCIQHAGTSERLPSASTCMNLLKLPEFPSENVMKEKLLYAINAGAGFELS
ncbi:ubiquitin-protein ligase E3C isoform X2 [Arctopsyche grandis]|uniref:ubiquitin-protein ligase E3C isoform X2 n=1 Tax=Arctopsyche grandis TaxID=121162 RepID=UPI00406D66E6